MTLLDICFFNVIDVSIDTPPSRFDVSSEWSPQCHQIPLKCGPELIRQETNPGLSHRDKLNHGHVYII